MCGILCQALAKTPACSLTAGSISQVRVQRHSGTGPRLPTTTGQSPMTVSLAWASPLWGLGPYQDLAHLPSSDGRQGPLGPFPTWASSGPYAACQTG